MFRVILYTSIALLFLQNAFCQVKTVKKPVKTYPQTSRLSISGGMTRSVLFLSRNVKQNNDALGYHAAVMYGGRVFRFSAEYTQYRKVNIEPTWFNIKAHTIEANMQVITRFKHTHTYFYPIFGLSYNTFSGYYTGVDDFLNLGYNKNQVATTHWVGFNTGVGFEQFFKQASIFGEYKLRMGLADRSQLNIMDICMSLGLRYRFKVPSFYKIFSGTRNRYILDAKEVED